ncbi:MAG: endonuclease domain-containing protein [Halothiobacillaceae bacterium]
MSMDKENIPAFFASREMSDLPPSPSGREMQDLPPSPAGGRGAGGEGALERQPATLHSFKPRPPSPIPAHKLAFARELRLRQTDAEQLIWGLLRNRRLKNVKFRRQHPLGAYILDFYCAEHSLVIELDGGQHGEQRRYDAQRDQWLAVQGLRVLRFWNNQVLQETEAVLTVIWDALPDESPVPETLLPPTNAPSPPAGFAPLASLSPPAGEGSKAKAVPRVSEGDNVA